MDEKEKEVIYIITQLISELKVKYIILECCVGIESSCNDAINCNVEEILC